MTTMSTGTDHSPDASPREVGKALLKKVRAYDPKYDRAKILSAIEFAMVHHGEQKRYSGDPYFYHPVAVAEILADMKMDQRTIVTALLHDTIEDTDATFELIEETFGNEVAQLVDGVTKLTQMEFQTENQKQAENFRKLLVAISEDIRVLMVKLADRLHNMRTLHYIENEKKRKRIAHETMEIYANLAERIGMQQIKDELQDIAFQELHPEGYKSVVSRLDYLREQDEGFINRTVKILKKTLKEENIDAEVFGREKKPYSIWRKMQKKNVTFEQLSDISAFRIIVKSKDECYHTLGIIHDRFHNIPDTFRDYISTMKANGYQSIHTVVMGPEQRRIEIQIRTEQMHNIAEHGFAAHWSYKQDQEASGLEARRYRWIRELLYLVEHAPEPEEFLENTKMEMYQDQVFCFTPRGDLIALPKGGTPVDFAFAVHSQVGRNCAGVKINGRIMPLRTQLRNGDQVEIIRSKSAQPSPNWEHFVVTGKARSEIRRFMRDKEREEYLRLGKEMLEKSLLSHHEKFQEKALEPLVEKFDKKNVDDIIAAVGEGTLARQEVLRELYPEKFKPKRVPSLLSRLTRKRRPEEKGEKLSVPIVGLIPGLAIHYAGCCHPLPGDKITGIVNTGKGVTIHTADCSELEQYIDQPERWIDVSWEQKDQTGTFIGRLKAVLEHKKGSLGTLANAVAKSEGNIYNVRITNRATDFFEIILDVEVRDVDHFEAIIAALRAKPDIHSVERYQEGK